MMTIPRRCIPFSVSLTVFLLWALLMVAAGFVHSRETIIFSATNDDGRLVIHFDNGDVQVCPLHFASFDGTAGVTAYVTTCLPDDIFHNGFEE